MQNKQPGPRRLQHARAFFTYIAHPPGGWLLLCSCLCTIFALGWSCRCGSRQEHGVVIGKRKNGGRTAQWFFKFLSQKGRGVASLTPLANTVTSLRQRSVSLSRKGSRWLWAVVQEAQMGSRRASARLLQQVMLGTGLIVGALQQFNTREFQSKAEISGIAAVCAWEQETRKREKTAYNDQRSGDWRKAPGPWKNF